MQRKKYSLLAILLLFLFSVQINAQGKHKSMSPDGLSKIKLLEDTLVVLGYAIVNDSAEVNRFAACKTFIPHLVEALKVENSFSFPFERLHTVSILTAPDSSFRVFTWQLFVNDSTYRYYGAIQMNSSKLQLFPLVDRSFEMDSPTSEVLTPDRWYGALYYGIQKVKTAKESYYVLFGFDAYTFFDKRKVMEVLQFDAAGKPEFGKQIFERPNSEFEVGNQQNRLILEYSSSTSIKCNYDENLGLIIFDHLIPIQNPFGYGMTYVTDGSYEGFKITNKGLVYVPKVFEQVSDEAPSPEPIQAGRKDKDLFGKKKKG